jgi:hypothetical protein
MANRRPSQFFRKGDPNINRQGRPRENPPKEKSGRGPGRLPGEPNQRRPPLHERPAVITWDLKMAARSFCKEALTFIVETMRDPNETRDTRMKAAGMLLERGYGRPLQEAVVDVNHAFVVAPQTLPVDEWLRTKGQGDAGNAWLAAQRAREGGLAAPPTENRATDVPASGAGHSADEVLDLEAKELLDPDPTKPPPAGTKLN